MPELATSTDISKTRLAPKRNVYYEIANAKTQASPRYSIQYFLANVPWMIITTPHHLESCIHATPRTSKVQNVIEDNSDRDSALVRGYSEDAVSLGRESEMNTHY